LINQNKQLLKVKIQGMGEPLINKHFFEMINICEENGVFVETITNGSLLTENAIENIFKSKMIYRVSISIDGATKEVFEKIRVRSNFDVVIDNVKNLSKQIKYKKKNINLRAMCLLQKQNFHQFEDIIFLCKNLGFNELEFQVQMTGWGKSEWENINQKQDINFNNLKNIEDMKNIINKYNDKSFKASFVETNLLSEKNKCSYPWHNPYISANGSVVSCCMIGDPSVNNYGNINDTNFNKIWNSKDYLELRNSIINHKLKDFCKNCYKNPSQ